MTINTSAKKQTSTALNNKGLPTLDTLITDLMSTHWTIFVEKIKKATGIRSGSDLLNRHSRLPAGSFAVSQGSETLSEFIENPPHKGGLGLTWRDWEMKCKALQFKYHFNLNDPDYESILNRVESTAKSLGRMPSSADELEYLSPENTILPIAKGLSLEMRLKHRKAIETMNGASSEYLPLTNDEDGEKNCEPAQGNNCANDTAVLPKEHQNERTLAVALQIKSFQKKGRAMVDRIKALEAESAALGKHVRDLNGTVTSLRKVNQLQKLTIQYLTALSSRKTNDIFNANAALVITTVCLGITIFAFVDLAFFRYFIGTGGH